VIHLEREWRHHASQCRRWRVSRLHDDVVGPGRTQEKSPTSHSCLVSLDASVIDLSLSAAVVRY
jgi:hypothetical protein